MDKERKHWFLRYKGWIGLLSLAPAFWMIALFLFDLTVNRYRSCQQEKELVAEIQQVMVMPESRLVEDTSYCGANKVSVHRSYAAAQSREDILGYYDKELKRLGWIVLPQEAGTVDGRPLSYCKGDFTAAIRYGSGYEWNYYLSLTAGLISDCEMRKGGGFGNIPFSDLWFVLGCFGSWLVYGIVMYAIIWQKNAKTYLDSFEKMLRVNARPANVWAYRISTTIIILVSALGISISLYKILMYLLSFLMDR